MGREKFDKILQDKMTALEIVLDEKQKEQFYCYMELLLEWNQKINLTAIIEPEEIILKHFVDSATILKEIEENKKLIDVGTGAGFPGIPLKILNPSLDITLLDSLNKRIMFLEEVIKKLGLNKIRAIHGRAEEYARVKEGREKYDYATSRAVAKLNILSEYLLPLLKVGGKCICMKGAEVKEECEEGKAAVSILGGRIDKIDTFELPSTEIKRHIIKISKIKNTPKTYPRKPGIPAKKPL